MNKYKAQDMASYFPNCFLKFLERNWNLDPDEGFLYWNFWTSAGYLKYMRKDIKKNPEHS